MKPSDSPLLWFVGILLTGLVGNWFRTRENRKSQSVKDLRSKIDAIFGDIDDLEELALEYFLKPGNDEQVQQEGLKIKTKLKRIATRVNAIHKDTNLVQTGGSSALTKLMHLRRAVTLEDFDSADRLAWTAADPRFDKVSTASAELKDVLEDLYRVNQ